MGTAKQELATTRRRYREKKFSAKKEAAARGAGVLTAVAGGAVEAKFGKKAKVGPFTYEGLAGAVLAGGGYMMKGDTVRKAVVTEMGWAAIYACARNASEEGLTDYFNKKKSSKSSKSSVSTEGDFDELDDELVL